MSVNNSDSSIGQRGAKAPHASKNASDPSLRDRAGDVYDSARTAAIDAYGSAKDSAAQVGTRASDGIDEAPLIALAGGIAAGALLAALLPRTKTEDRLLGPAGERITGSAQAAVDAAKQAGREKLNELNLTRDAGTSALETLFKGVSDAALGSVRAKS